MEVFIRILIFFCLAIFFTKFYIHSKINAVDKNSSPIYKMIFGEVGFGIMLPIRKKAENDKERKLIKIANILICLFYLFFAVSMVISLIVFNRDF